METDGTIIDYLLQFIKEDNSTTEDEKTVLTAAVEFIFLQTTK